MAALVTAAVGGVWGTQPASAHCRYNVRWCYGGHCYINAGTCYGSCYINTGYCGSGASCYVNVGTCTNPGALIIDLCPALPECED